VLGAVIGALVMGLLVAVYLFASNNNGNTAGVAQPTAVAANTAVPGGENPTVALDVTAGPTPPRMTLADFKALYDDPAKRPLIIDVRAKEAFDAGHIKGSISFPESDVDTRVGELPKDKLVVAYCQ